MTKSVSDLKFYRIIKDEKLFAFGDTFSSLPVLGNTLGEYQNYCIEKSGHSVIDCLEGESIKDDSYFKFDEDLLFTPSFIDQVLKKIEDNTSSQHFYLEANDFNERFVLPHSKEKSENLKFNFFFVNKADQKSQSTCIEQYLYPTEVRLPQQIVVSGIYKVDQCDTFCTRIASPFHLLQANLALNFMRTIEWKRRIPLWLSNRFSKPNGRNTNRVLKYLNKKGKNCSIHPSAIIEASVIGDNVSIGAHCTIRLAHIGSGTTIQDNVSVVQSVIGENNVISHNNHISMSQTFNDVYLIHGPYQFSIFGKSSAVFALINCDIRLDNKNIKIPTDIGVIDSHQPLLGIAFGHRSKVGGGNIIAPGRIVPNDRHINPPESIILDFE